MSKEIDDYGIAKPNRRRLDEKKDKVIKHQTVLLMRTKTKKERERDLHALVSKARKRRN